MAAKCKVCAKAVYPMDPQINLDGTKFHKACAKCGDCGCQITVSNFTKNESSEQTILLCKIHYFKRFHEGGSYLGGDKFKVKADRDLKPSTSAQNPVSSSSTTSADATVFPGVKVGNFTSPTKASPPVPAKKDDTVAEPVATAVVSEPAAPVVVAEAEVPTLVQAAEEPTSVQSTEEEAGALVSEQSVDSSEQAHDADVSGVQDSVGDLVLQEIPTSED